MTDEKIRIAAELGVAQQFDALAEIDRRILFLVEYAREATAKSLVLGIRGGVDSTVAPLPTCGAAVALRRAADPATAKVIREAFRRTAHKRALPAFPASRRAT